MSVPIEVEGSSIRAGSPAPVFDDPAWINLIGHSCDISPDGSRFVIVRSEQQRTSSEIRLIEGSRSEGDSWPR